MKTSGMLMTPFGTVKVVPLIYNTCCDPPNLPWFNRMIDPPSTADIELRLCQDKVAILNEDMSVELYELYVYWTGYLLSSLVEASSALPAPCNV